MFFVRFDTTGDGFPAVTDVAAAVSRISEQVSQGKEIGTVRDSNGRSVGSWILTDKDVYEDGEPL